MKLVSNPTLCKLTVHAAILQMKDYSTCLLLHVLEIESLLVSIYTVSFWGLLKLGNFRLKVPVTGKTLFNTENLTVIITLQHHTVIIESLD